MELECARAVHSAPYITFLEALPNSINDPGAKYFIGTDIEVGDGTREAVFLAAGAVIEVFLLKNLISFCNCVQYTMVTIFAHVNFNGSIGV